MSQMTTTTEVTLPPQASVTIEFQMFEDADQQHLSALYWSWRELFERDSAARITQHPDFVLTELAGSTNERRIVLCKATQGEQLVGLGILVPKNMTTQQAGGRGLAMNFHGLRLAGNRFLGQLDSATQSLLLRACVESLSERHSLYLLIEDLE